MAGIQSAPKKYTHPIFVVSVDRCWGLVNMRDDLVLRLAYLAILILMRLVLISYVREEVG